MQHKLFSARILKGFLHLFGVSAVLLAGLPTGEATANECSPMPPCPCAADGTCRPKRDTWGTYTTRWRPWPGEVIGEPPTKDELQGPTVREQLPTHVLPPAEKEDLRGPARPPRTSKQSTGSPEEPPLGAPNPGPNPAPAEGLPLENFELPGLDPQGSNNLPPRPQAQASTPQLLPSVEDGPPALPTSLRQALTQSPANATPAADMSLSASSSANKSSTIVVAAVPFDSAPELPREVVRPASAILLTNPAAKSVVGEDEALQQAIYYESSDF